MPWLCEPPDASPCSSAPVGAQHYSSSSSSSSSSLPIIPPPPPSLSSLLLLPPLLCSQGESPPQQRCAAAAGHTARDQEVHGPQRAGLQPSGYSKALGEGCPWSRTEAPALFPAVAFPCPTKAHSLSSADFTATEERPTVSDPVVCRWGFTEQTEALVLTAWLAGTGARRAGGRSCWTSLLGACAREALLALANVD